jgi:4-hydroxy-L-threonine phosphate dehydrogenase PdxA
MREAKARAVAAAGPEAGEHGTYGHEDRDHLRLGQ